MRLYLVSRNRFRYFTSVSIDQLNIFKFKFELCVGFLSSIIDVLRNKHEYLLKNSTTYFSFFDCTQFISTVSRYCSSFQCQMTQIHANRRSIPDTHRNQILARKKQPNILLLKNAMFREEKIGRLKININIQNFDFLDIMFHENIRAMFYICICRICHLFHTRTTRNIFFVAAHLM